MLRTYREKPVILLATGLGRQEKARPYELAGMLVARRRGVVGECIRMPIDHQNEDIERSRQRISTAARIHVMRGEVILCGVSLAGSEMLTEGIALKRRLASAQARRLRICAVETRLQGSEKLNIADYVNKNRAKSVTNEQGFRSLVESVVTCEEVLPNLKPHETEGIHLVVPEKEDKMDPDDALVPFIPYLQMPPEVDTHVGAHLEFCRNMPYYLTGDPSLMATPESDQFFYARVEEFKVKHASAPKTLL